MDAKSFHLRHQIKYHLLQNGFFLSIFCPDVVINNFTDFELLYNKFAALRYNEDKFEWILQFNNRERAFLHDFVGQK